MVSSQGRLPDDAQPPSGCTIAAAKHFSLVSLSLSPFLTTVRRISPRRTVQVNGRNEGRTAHFQSQLEKFSAEKTARWYALQISKKITHSSINRPFDPWWNMGE